MRGGGRYTSVDSNGRIILDIQINMFLNSESEIPSLAEIALLQFIFFDFQTSFKDLFRLGINTYTMAKKAGERDGEGSTFGPRTVT